MSVFGNSELFEEFENPDISDAVSNSGSDDSVEDEYKEKYRNLKVENEKLKKSLRLFERPANMKIKDSSNDGPVAHVILFNNVIARKFREEIKDFFFDLSNRRLNGDYSVCTEPQPAFIQYSSPSHHSHKHRKSSRRSEATKKAFQAFSSIQIFKNFYVDQLGEPLSFEDPKFSDWFFPEYDRLSYEPMNGDPDDYMQQTKKRKKLQRICFNCGGSDHQMKECEKPRDHQAIYERRQKFMDEVAKYSDGSPQIRVDGPRYHEEDEDEDKADRFKHFKPGVISAELQEALGITEVDIPPYIYQMRRLGYPPGHLQYARTKKSELTLYDNNSSNGENKENQYVPVEVGKIVGYPGFNIPPLPGQEDKFKEHCVGPMNDAQSKEVMVSYFEHRNNLFNQRKQAEQQAKERDEKEKIQNRDDADVEEVDMDIGGDEEISVLGEQEYIEFQPHAPPSPVVRTKREDSDLEEGEVEDDIEADVGSLTEDELEIKREMLLKELKKAASDSNNDSDYRNIKTNDHDYRLPPSVTIDLTGSTSESDVNLTIPVVQEEKEDLQPDVMIVESSSDDKDERDEQATAIKERNTSSDTDYRMNPAFISIRSNENSPITFNTDAVEEKSELDTPQSPDFQEKQTVSTEMTGDNIDSNSQPALPGRNKFAKGITQFDAYYSESKSQGVYKKLRTLLKDSPRRQQEWKKDVFS
ncbi:zinc finger CCHC domain-containing protein 8-like isoform X1 [Styela clava]